MTYPLFGNRLQNRVVYVPIGATDRPGRVGALASEPNLELQLSRARRADVSETFWLERLKELGVELLFLQDQTFVGGVTPELAMTRRHYPISTPLGYTSGPMWTAARSSATWSASTTEIPRSCLASHGVPAGFPMPSAEPIPNLEASPTFASPGVGRVSIPSRSLNGSGLGALQQERSEAGAKEPLDMNTIDDNIIDMRKKLPPKERLSQLVGLRMRPEEYRALKREGEAHGLDLQNYVRMLVKTHQSRKAGK